jgi:hypothetical protein
MNNLFGSTEKWFRFSEYEIIKGGRMGYYIKPCSGSEIEWYNPFDEYPDILKDSLNTWKEMKKIRNEWHNKRRNGRTNEEIKRSAQTNDNEETKRNKWLNEELNRMRKKAAEFFLKNFVNKYGLLGLFNKDLHSIHPVSCDVNDPFKTKYMVYHVPGMFNSLIRPGADSPMEYNEYIARFFPHLNKPYPYVYKDEERLDFFKNYSEPIVYIFADPILSNVFSHSNNLEKYKSGEATEKEELFINNFFLSTSFTPHINLKNRVINDYGDTKKDLWDLSWSFSTLSKALGLMYILDLTNKIEGNSIKKCNWCEDYFKVGTGDNVRKSDAKYCKNCKYARKKINRGRKAILKGNKTISEIAKKHNKDIEEVKRWIMNYNPDSREGKKLLKNYKKEP